MPRTPLFSPNYLDVRFFQPNGVPGRPAMTLAEHVYRDGMISVTVPKGFRTDFASVPRVLLWLYDPFGRHQRAAMFHDWLYSSKPCSRYTADAVFRTIMEADGVAKWRRLSMYVAVRVFGWLAWSRKSV